MRDEGGSLNTQGFEHTKEGKVIACIAHWFCEQSDTGANIIPISVVHEISLHVIFEYLNRISRFLGATTAVHLCHAINTKKDVKPENELKMVKECLKKTNILLYDKTATRQKYLDPKRTDQHLLLTNTKKITTTLSLTEDFCARSVGFVAVGGGGVGGGFVAVGGGGAGIGSVGGSAVGDAGAIRGGGEDGKRKGSGGRKKA